MVLQFSTKPEPAWAQLGVGPRPSKIWEAAASGPRTLADRRNDRNPNRKFFSGLARSRTPAGSWISRQERRPAHRNPAVRRRRREPCNRIGFVPANSRE